MSELERPNALSDKELNVTKTSPWNPIYKTGYKRWLIVTLVCSVLFLIIFAVLLATESSQTAIIIFAILGFSSLIFSIVGFFFIPDEDI